LVRAGSEEVTVEGHERVTGFVHSADWERLPLGVRKKVKLCLLDVLGAAVSGTLTRVGKLVAEYAAETWPGGEATILLHDQRARAVGASFANSYTANALDIDDSGQYTKGHPGAQIFGTALAMAETFGRSGAEMLTAMVVGYEVAHRIGRCWHDSHSTYQACGSWGSVATAAVAAHLMRLSQEKIPQALGIAEYNAPNLPMMRDVDCPTMAKHGMGWGGMTGVIAAEMAARGFTAPPSMLTSERYDKWVTDIGNRYVIEKGVIFKEFACCGWAQPPLHAAREVLLRYSVPPADIERIRVFGFDETVRLGAEQPATTEEAQFNTAWPLAMFILDGEVGPRQMLEERLQDEAAQVLASKVELVQSEEINRMALARSLGKPTGRYASRVEFWLRDGQRLDSGVVVGGPNYGQDWTAEQVERKFRWLAQHRLSSKVVEELLMVVRRFDEFPDVTVLTSTLQP
jgi:2-methylcitrate dehydratase PrpD